MFECPDTDGTSLELLLRMIASAGAGRGDRPSLKECTRNSVQIRMGTYVHVI